MIAGLRGTVESKLPDGVLLSVGGIVLKVHLPLSTLDRINGDSGQVYLHTHLYVREGAMALYGFASRQELELFELLLTVAGVGPKVALALLSALSPSRLTSAIAQKDIALLSSVPGVGKRIAERIAVELRGKLEKAGHPSAEAGVAGLHGQVVAALTALGYSPAESQAALRALPPDDNLDVGQAVRLCLAFLADRPT